MAKDTLICVEDLDAFKKYLHSRGIRYTQGSNKTKVLHIYREHQTYTLTKKHKNTACITVPKELYPLVRDFITHRKRG